MTHKFFLTDISPLPFSFAYALFDIWPPLSCQNKLDTCFVFFFKLWGYTCHVCIQILDLVVIVRNYTYSVCAVSKRM